ncbi:MAG: hypothetical protein PHX68_03105 [Alphaproteobacteria bacterium]|nr:hypothetical protein [Alphaproteobacteria bacterium]
MIPQHTESLLSETSHYAAAYRNRLILIKCSGKVLDDAAARASVIGDILHLKSLGIDIILIHGGQTAITQALEAARAKHPGVTNTAIDGRRATDETNIGIIAKTLASVNKSLVDDFRREALRAGSGAAVSGIPGSAVFKSTPPSARTSEGLINYEGGVNISANLGLLRAAMARKRLVILSPLGLNAQDENMILNQNADDVIAPLMQLKPVKLILVSDKDGVHDADNRTISQLSRQQAESLMQSGVIAGGMRVKVAAMIDLLQRNGALSSVSIVNGLVPGAIRQEVLTASGAPKATKLASRHFLRIDTLLMELSKELTR